MGLCDKLKKSNVIYEKCIYNVKKGMSELWGWSAANRTTSFGHTFAYNSINNFK